jgi:hypothetical protein
LNLDFQELKKKKQCLLSRAAQFWIWLLRKQPQSSSSRCKRKLRSAIAMAKERAGDNGALPFPFAACRSRHRWQSPIGPNRFFNFCVPWPLGHGHISWIRG